MLFAILALAGIHGGVSAHADSNEQEANAARHASCGTFLGNHSSVLSHQETSEKACRAADEFPASMPFGVDVVGDDVWLTTVGDHRIWRTSVSPKSDRTVCHVAGNGAKGYEGDGGPASQAAFNWPHEVRADEFGNLYVADTRNHVIRWIEKKTGIVRTLAGNGKQGFAGDGASGPSVEFNQPHSIVLDGDGGLLVADTVNHRLRRIDLKSGIIRTICGTGERVLPTDGAAIVSSPLFGPRSLAVDENSIWVALREGNSIWRIDRKSDTIHHVAGSGKKGYRGDGGLLGDAQFSGPKGIALSGARSLAIVDTENHAIRVIDIRAKSLSTVLGGTLAKETFPMKRPHGIAYHPGLGLLVADSENDRILFLRNE